MKKIKTLHSHRPFFICTILYSHLLAVLITLFTWGVNDSFESIATPRNFACALMTRSSRSFIKMVLSCACLLRCWVTGRTFSIFKKFLFAPRPYSTQSCVTNLCPEYTTAYVVWLTVVLDEFINASQNLGPLKVRCGTPTCLHSTSDHTAASLG